MDQLPTFARASLKQKVRFLRMADWFMWLVAKRPGFLHIPARPHHQHQLVTTAHRGERANPPSPYGGSSANGFSTFASLTSLTPLVQNMYTVSVAVDEWKTGGMQGWPFLTTPFLALMQLLIREPFQLGPSFLTLSSTTYLVCVPRYIA